MGKITQLTQKWASLGLKLHQRRLVAPVIATLLLVAIAVIGGSIIFVFSQGFFATAQVSGSPQIESVEIVGFDASDVVQLTLHDGVLSGVTDGTLNNAILAGERIAIYVQNQSAQKVTISELRLAGTEYFYNQTNPLAANAADEGAYFVVLRGISGNPAETSAAIVGELEAGAEVTIIVDLVGGIQNGRDIQFRITTAHGATFVGTAIAGQQSG